MVDVCMDYVFILYLRLRSNTKYYINYIRNILDLVYVGRDRPNTPMLLLVFTCSLNLLSVFIFNQVKTQKSSVQI